MLKRYTLLKLLVPLVLASSALAQDGFRFQSQQLNTRPTRSPAPYPHMRQRQLPQNRGQQPPRTLAPAQVPYNPSNPRFPIAYQPSQRLLSSSGFYIQPPPPQEVRKHDIITVRVDMLSSMEAEGNVEMRRNANYNAVLSDWLIIDFFRWIKPSPQSNGDPTIAGTLNRQNRAEGDIDSSERLQFNIAAEVVDIYPNGNLVLRGENVTRINNEIWKISFSGICRSKDILPNNTVLSSNVLNLKIDKEEYGQVRDAYRRGWFTRWFDRFHPF